MSTANQELSRLSDVIGLIYEGATDPARWTKDILPTVAEYIQAPECILFTSLHRPQDGGYFFLHGIVQDHVDLYMNKYHDDDLWTIAVVEKNLFSEAGSVLIGDDDLVPRKRLLESKFYKECLSRDKNMAQIMCGVIFGMKESNSMPAVCSFFRGLHHPNFGLRDRERMELLVPHLSRSLGVMQRIRTSELAMATSHAALDRLPTGVLLIDAVGEVTFANRAAQRMLELGDGLRLKKLTRSSGLGQLVASNDLANRTIAAAISSALNFDPYNTEHFSNCAIVPRSSAQSTYMLQFSALGEHAEFNAGSNAPAAMVFLSDGAEQVEVDPTLLQSAYGLTPAEARVAIALLECSSAQEVADYLGANFNTVRTQIREIYAKLGVDSRARFTKLMLGLTKLRQ